MGSLPRYARKQNVLNHCCASMFMTAGKRNRIAIFQKMACEWVSAHPVLSTRIQCTPAQFIRMDENEQIEVWIGFLDDAYQRKHIAPDQIGYCMRFCEVLTPLLEQVADAWGRKQHGFPIGFYGYRDSVLWSVGVGY